MFQEVDEAYKLTKKQNNGFIYALYWRLGYVFARFFRFLHIPPNIVSTFSMIFYIGSGYCFYLAEDYNLWGGIFFFFGILMDCTDGKLARMTAQTSKLGIWLDYNYDYLRPLFIYPPIALQLFRSTQNTSFLIFAFLAISSTLVYTIISMRWDGFDFAQKHKIEYTSNSKYHKLLKQFYFLEGIEPLTVIFFAIISRMDIFIIIWSVGVTGIYIMTTIYYGYQIHKKDSLQ